MIILKKHSSNALQKTVHKINTARGEVEIISALDEYFFPSSGLRK